MRRIGVALGLLLSMVLIAGVLPGLTDADAGRLLVRPGFASRGEPGGLLVFQESLGGGRLRCTEFLNGGREVTVRRDEVRALELHRQCHPYAVGVYALNAMAAGNRDRVYMQLTRFFDSPRGTKIREMEAAVRGQMPELEKLLAARREAAEAYAAMVSGGAGSSATASSSSDFVGDPVELIENGRPIALISEAIAEGDFFQATAMFEYYRRCVSAATRASDREVGAFMQRNAQLLVNGFRGKRLGLSEREREFRRVCPDIGGAWSMAMPESYPALLELFAHSFNSFRRLDELSTLAEFPEWGAAALDALLLLTDSPAAVEPGGEFDRELAAYLRRSGGGKK